MLVRSAPRSASLAFLALIALAPSGASAMPIGSITLSGNLDTYNIAPQRVWASRAFSKWRSASSSRPSVVASRPR